MERKQTRSGRGCVCSALLAAVVFTGPAPHAQTRPIDSPPVTTVATDLGPIEPTEQVTLTVHLNMHDQKAFDSAVQDLYTPGSPTYHLWMTNSQIAGYAPTAAQVQAVISALKSNGLSVLATAPDNLSIRVRGTAQAVEKAFQTRIHQFQHEGKTFHANMTPATLAGTAGSLVRGVSGLTNLPMRSNLRYQVNPTNGQQLKAQQAPGSGLSGLATNDCFGDSASVTLTASGAALPVGVYVGTTYAAGGVPCSWTPAQVQSHYGLTAAYSQGLDGTGQTIVIVDGPVDAAQLQSDLTQFASLSGLPAITSSNFTVLYPDGQPTPLELLHFGEQGRPHWTSNGRTPSHLERES